MAAAWSAGWDIGSDGWSARRRLIAVLRLAYRVVGLGRQRALGKLGGGAVSALLLATFGAG